MPKVNWCKTKVLRREEAAKALMTRIDAECAANGVSYKELADKIGMNYATYLRRRTRPQLLSVEEIQKIADRLNLSESEDFKKALYNLIV